MHLMTCETYLSQSWKILTFYSAHAHKSNQIHENRIRERHFSYWQTIKLFVKNITGENSLEKSPTKSSL